MNDIEKVEQIVSNLRSTLIQMSSFIHANPELGLAEFKACDIQCDLLKQYGFEVEKGVYSLDTAYKAVYRSRKPGPKFAMLSEYDALPGLGHGCGHNLIAMVGVGAGIAIKDFIDEYGGEIHVIGTPAEETLGGKVVMARQGAFEGFDVAMMSHPMGRNSDSMNTIAMKELYFKFHGKSAHASASPYEGINALDAVLNFFNLVNAFRQETKSDAKIHGIITNGGSATNVIPDLTEAVMCIRANKAKYLEELTEKVLDCAKGAALGTGCTLEYGKNGEEYRDTQANRTLAEIFSKNIEKLGESVVRTEWKPGVGSSDMGDVSYRCPAVQNTFDINFGDDFAVHTKEFAERAGTEQAMDAALTYVKGHVLTMLELLKNPESLAAVKAEFEKNNQ